MPQESGLQNSLGIKGTPIVHRFEFVGGAFPKKVLAGGVVLAVILGVMTGFLLSRPGGIKAPTKGIGAPGVKVSDHKVGIQDTKTFRDCTKGQLETGGISGEGTHHLVREGGPSQTAYLTSSVVDLDQFVGKMVEVCGQTIASKRAGWLMDVGLVKTSE